MIAMQKDPANLLKTLANPVVPAAKTPPRERCLLGRDTEEAPPDPAQYSSQIVIGIHLGRCTSRYVGTHLSHGDWSILSAFGWLQPRATVRRDVGSIGRRPAPSARTLAA